jgi:hypothetical protein
MSSSSLKTPIKHQWFASCNESNDMYMIVRSIFAYIQSFIGTMELMGYGTDYVWGRSYANVLMATGCNEND